MNIACKEELTIDCVYAMTISNLFTSEMGSNRVKVVGALVLLLHALTADVPAVSRICSITPHLADRKGKKRKDYAFRRQSDEKPSVIPSCPGP